MSCEITLLIEKPGLQSAQFLLLTWRNWAEDTEDEDNLSNLNSDDRDMVQEALRDVNTET